MYLVPWESPQLWALSSHRCAVVIRVQEPGVSGARGAVAGGLVIAVPSCRCELEAGWLLHG